MKEHQGREFQEPRVPDGPCGGAAPPASTLCRYVKTPLPDCYCVNMTGRKIIKIARFCAGNFAACPIFQRQAQAWHE